MIRVKNAGKVLVGLALLAAFGAAPALAVGDIIGIEPNYWSQAMTGTVRIDGDTLQGTSIDLQDSLGLARNDRLYSGRFWIHWMQRNYLYFTTAHSGHAGTQTLSAPIIFDDQTFGAGEVVRSRIETDLKTLHYGYNFLDLRLVKLGFRVGADRLGFDADMRSRTTPSRASTSDSVTFPVGGLGATFEPMPWLRFQGEISALSARLSGDNVRFYDGRVQAEVYWAHFFGIVAGYRRVKINVDSESFGKADVNQKGPYAGFVFRF